MTRAETAHMSRSSSMALPWCSSRASSLCSWGAGHPLLAGPSRHHSAGRASCRTTCPCLGLGRQPEFLVTSIMERRHDWARLIRRHEVAGRRQGRVSWGLSTCASHAGKLLPGCPITALGRTQMSKSCWDRSWPPGVFKEHSCTLRRRRHLRP